MQRQFLQAGVPVLVVVAAVYAALPQSSMTIAVDAGKLDRRDTFVSFELPAGIKGQVNGLGDDSGSRIPLQVDTNGRATFLLRELKAGQTRQYRILTGNDGRVSNRVEATSDGRLLYITADGHAVLDYRIKGELPRPDLKPSFLRAGYIHPAYTPAGRVVTDEYPSDHPHQDGIFFAWTKTEFEGRQPDFWNIGTGTGKVELDALENAWSGPVHGGFEARLRYVDLSGPAPKAALQEHWRVTAYRAGMFDLVSTQHCATDSPLILPEYRYGGLGVRGHHEWRNKEHVSFLTSEGKDRINGDESRARWSAMSGRVEGQVVGIAVLGHPDNFRAPQPLRIHPDDPYFTFSPSKIGSWEITPGKPYVSRYRFIVFDGPPNAAELDRLWNDFASPPKVTIVAR